MQIIIESSELQQIKNVHYNEGREEGYKAAMLIVSGILTGRKGLVYGANCPRETMQTLELLQSLKDAVDKIK